ncbi:unnamed protein product [Protopolystoma xenopodis]|uniref:Uncharacterized protein n=1 Tax=Protopolystoma xenopodis TaxID=117903 RepID=A0A3S5ATF2_9PLAT|nr:unnamed protein product [Protopolystoma xenopodis]
MCDVCHSRPVLIRPSDRPLLSLYPPRRPYSALLLLSPRQLTLDLNNTANSLADRHDRQLSQCLGSSDQVGLFLSLFRFPPLLSPLFRTLTLSLSLSLSLSHCRLGEVD